MTAITVTIDLDELHEGYIRDSNGDDRPQTLLDVILAMAAHQVVESLNRDRAMIEVRERVASIRDEEIRAALHPQVRAALQQAIQPTRRYSANPPPDVPITVAQYLIETAEHLLREPVRMNNSTTKPYVVSIFEAELGAALRTELKAALDEGKAQVMDALRTAGADVLQQTIDRMASGRS